MSTSRSLTILALFLLLPPALPGASLWMKATNNERSMFADRRAHARGDILTVLVTESNNLVTTLRTTTDKTAGILNEVSQWLFTPSASGFGTHNGELPRTEIDGDNDFTGGGEVRTTQTLTARVTVTVVDVLPNGNLIIEGGRTISSSRETQYAVLRGIVRQVDISTLNTVTSDLVADARIEFFSEGEVTAAQKKGWLLRLNDKVNPF